MSSVEVAFYKWALHGHMRPYQTRTEVPTSIPLLHCVCGLWLRSLLIIPNSEIPHLLRLVCLSVFESSGVDQAARMSLRWPCVGSLWREAR